MRRSFRSAHWPLQGRPASPVPQINSVSVARPVAVRRARASVPRPVRPAAATTLVACGRPLATLPPRAKGMIDELAGRAHWLAGRAHPAPAASQRHDDDDDDDDDDAAKLKRSRSSSSLFFRRSPLEVSAKQRGARARGGITCGRAGRRRLRQALLLLLECRRHAF
jgi:ribosomal protein L34E